MSLLSSLHRMIATISIIFLSGVVLLCLFTPAMTFHAIEALAKNPINPPEDKRCVVDSNDCRFINISWYDWYECDIREGYVLCGGKTSGLMDPYCPRTTCHSLVKFRNKLLLYLLHPYADYGEGFALIYLVSSAILALCYDT